MKKLNATNIELKYLEALKDLKETTEANFLFTMSDFLVSKKINRNMGRVLLNKGIIKKISTNQLEWVSKTEPNLHMVRIIINELNIIGKNYHKESKDINSQDKSTSGSEHVSLLRPKVRRKNTIDPPQPAKVVIRIFGIPVFTKTIFTK